MLAVALVVTSVSCLASTVQEQRGERGERPAPQVSPLPWAEKSGEVFVSRGVSRIERVGARYLLTTYCTGVHSIYAQGEAGINLDDYLGGGFVRVQFTSASMVNPNIHCVQAPCKPVTEHIIRITAVKHLVISPADLLSYQQMCTIEDKH